jgi:hypothetical protein
VKSAGKDAEDPPDTFWEIYDDDNGLPGASISKAGYRVIRGDNWPIRDEWTSIEVDTDTPLKQGQKYYWVARVSPNVATTSRVWVWRQASAGDVRYFSNDGVNWTAMGSGFYVYKVEAPILEKVLVSPFKTWRPGQIVSIDLPDRGVTGEYLVQKVTLAPTFSKPSIWTYRIEYGGRLLGIADFLKALVSAQQKKQIVDTAILSKFVYGEDKINVVDEIDFTYTMEDTKVEQSLETTALAFETVGSMLTVSCPGTWANPKYRTSSNGEDWSAWREITPNGVVVQVAYPGYVELQANGEINIYNWKKPMIETNVVCGFVVVG